MSIMQSLRVGSVPVLCWNQKIMHYSFAADIAATKFGTNRAVKTHTGSNSGSDVRKTADKLMCLHTVSSVDRQNYRRRAKPND